MRKTAPFFLIPSETEEEKSGTKFPSPLLSKFLIPVGSVLIAAIALLSGNVNLPSWAIWGVILYLVVVIGVVFTYPCTKLISLVQEKRMSKRIARTFYPQLEDTAKEFTELTRDNRAFTMLYFLQQVNSWDEFKEKRIPLDAVHWIRSWLESIRKRLDAHRTADFNGVAWDLSLLISQYHYLCVHAEEHLDPIVRGGAIPDQRLRLLKQQWGMARENHMHLIKNWEQLARKVNAMAGERVCLDFYEPIKTIE